MTNYDLALAVAAVAIPLMGYVALQFKRAIR